MSYREQDSRMDVLLIALMFLAVTAALVVAIIRLT